MSEQQTNPKCICSHSDADHEDLLGCTYRDRDGFGCPCEHRYEVGEPTPPATPQPRHRVTDWIPTDGCDCDKCMSARKSATPQPETLTASERQELDGMLDAVLLPEFTERERAIARMVFERTRELTAIPALSPPPDVERLTREAFKAGFLAVCRMKSDDTPLDMLTRVWTFDGIAAADLEPEAYAAWLALSSTPGEPT